MTITGTDLTGATEVAFRNTAATSFTVVSATEVTAVSPARAAGTVDVTVTTPGGTSLTTAADQFTYAARPAVTAISPTAGPPAGGTTVTITGTDLTGATEVAFRNTAATSFTVVSATEVTAVSPARAAGTVDVTVTTPGGTSLTTAADQFTYAARPTVTAISPTAGPPAGGTTVTITGTDLTGATEVAFRTTAATSFTVVSATEVTAVSPARAAGTVDVTVTTPGGTSLTTAADQFTYAARPTVTAISPTAGPVAGGTTVTITGTDLTGATEVAFRTTAATSFTVVSATEVTAVTPARAAGTVDVTVTTPGGTSLTTAADQFTYAARPTVTAISPTAGPVAGGTTVTITGTDLTGATEVAFRTTAATSFTVVSATEVLAVSPARAAGTVDVTVTTPGGTSLTTAADQFTYEALPPVMPPFPPAGVSYPNAAIVTFGADHYVFAGGRAFLASASELAAVQKVDPAKIVVAEPVGTPAPTSVAPRPGVTLFTQPVNGNVTIYVVGSDGELHPFATPTQFLRDGYNGANVITVPNLGGLTVGSNAGNTLTALVTKADGAIVDSSGTLYTFAGGRAFGIPTPAALQEIRKSNSSVELQGSVSSADTGAPMANGVVLSVAGPVYVSYVGELYPFKTTTQLANTGYGGTPAIPAPDTGGLAVVFPYA